MTESALVKSATEPDQRPGKPPGLPFSTQMAVELSSGSNGHLATADAPTPGYISCEGKCVRLE